MRKNSFYGSRIEQTGGPSRRLPGLQPLQVSLARFAVRIHFYMPESCLPPGEELPFWLAGTPRKFSLPGKASTAQNWILLTCGRLMSAGADVSLCSKIPEDGIVIALTGNLPAGYRAPSGAFLVGVVADGLPHPACHLHIVQNAVHARRLPRSLYLPHWPQPGLIPRNPDRGDHFENLVFYGDLPNLAPPLREPAFADGLKSRLGISFRIARSADWHDYSETDCVLAIREFGRHLFLRKPATKLYNAWLAGVPFIGGSDSAYAAEGISDSDYVSCCSMSELLDALERLSRDRSFRRDLVRAGWRAAHRFTVESITEKWAQFACLTAPQLAARQFSKTTTGRKLSDWTQQAALLLDRLRGGY